MSDTDHSEKPEGKERGERRQRRAGREAKGTGDARRRLKYIDGRLEELKAERMKLKEERKALRQAMRGSSAKQDAPET